MRALVPIGKAGLALSLMVPGLGLAYAEDLSSPTFGSPTHFTETSGAAIYGAVCASCHMPRGQGAVGAGAYPALMGDPLLASARFVETRILYGRGAMPPFGRYLSDDQVASVAGYVQAQFGQGGGHGTPAAADVAALR